MQCLQTSQAVGSKRFKFIKCLTDIVRQAQGLTIPYPHAPRRIRPASTVIHDPIPLMTRIQQDTQSLLTISRLLETTVWFPMEEGIHLFHAHRREAETS